MSCRGCGCEMKVTRNKHKKVCDEYCWNLYRAKLEEAKRKFEWLK